MSNKPATPIGTVAAVPRVVEFGDVLREWFAHSTTYINNRVMLSGWEMEPAEAKWHHAFFYDFKVTVESVTKPVRMSKRFVEQRGGALTWEYKFKLSALSDGPSWSLCHDKQAVVGLLIAGGQLCALGRDGKTIPIAPVKANVDCGVRVTLNLTEKTFTLQVDGKTFAQTLSFAADVSVLDHFVFDTGKTFVGDAFLCPILIRKGYTLYEHFITTPLGVQPDNWTFSTQGGTATVQRPGGHWHEQDCYSLKLEDTSVTERVSASIAFAPVSGKSVTRFKVLIPTKVDGLRMELLGANQRPLLAIVTADGNLACEDGSGSLHLLRKDYKPTVWYELTCFTDSETGLADVHVNTVRVASGIPVKNGAGGLTGLRFVTAAAQAGVLWVDAVVVHQKQEYPADYVPEPQVVQTESPYLVAMQSCDLWREGTHLGWEWIKPHPERKPVLGWYNGGDPEVEDWAIKYMVENGVTFDFKCWYRPEREIGHPIHSTIGGEAIDGYRWARYSDKLKFAINITNHFNFFANMDDWKNNVVPYLLENLFADPRYMKVDNKPVLGIYDPHWMDRNVGDIKAALDFLREECRKAGYDGVWLIAQHRENNVNQMKDIKAWGFDTVYAYCWYVANAKKQEESIQTHQDHKIIDILPTLAMGWDTRAWDGPQGYWLKADEFKSLLQWAKDTYMAASPKDAMSSRMLMLDNWNEYGEGHCMLPSGIAGFGYVNAVREVFGTAPFPPNITPTEQQKARLDTLFPHGDW